MILDRKMQGRAQPDESLSFELRLEGTFGGVREALADVMKRLRPFPLSEEIFANIELVMAEALNNIAEHGFADLPQAGNIRVCCSMTAADLTCRITDFGQAMPNLALPPSAARKRSISRGRSRCIARRRLWLGADTRADP